MEIREERPGDEEAIREVNRLAFEGELEGRLIDALRTGGYVVASLVADDGGSIVGHALFSTLPIETDRGAVAGAALAPAAVRPARQRAGIGSALIRRGLALCRERGCAAVVVLGHPGYYPRFGFSAELAARLTAPYAGPALMALELVPGALDRGGTVRYAPPFAELE
ncbi:MAG: N-acetyltransferase [Thermomicrobiales bacterium]|nr:N-acetyltransferase [Thermomicrobiales bacterium]